MWRKLTDDEVSERYAEMERAKMEEDEIEERRREKERRKKERRRMRKMEGKGGEKGPQSLTEGIKALIEEESEGEEKPEPKEEAVEQ